MASNNAYCAVRESWVTIISSFCSTVCFLAYSAWTSLQSGSFPSISVSVGMLSCQLANMRFSVLFWCLLRDIFPYIFYKTVRSPSGARNVSFLPNIQTGCLAHPASHSLQTVQHIAFTIIITSFWFTFDYFFYVFFLVYNSSILYSDIRVQISKFLGAFAKLAKSAC